MGDFCTLKKLRRINFYLRAKIWSLYHLFIILKQKPEIYEEVNTHFIGLISYV